MGPVPPPSSSFCYRSFLLEICANLTSQSSPPLPTAPPTAEISHILQVSRCFRMWVSIEALAIASEAYGEMCFVLFRLSLCGQIETVKFKEWIKKKKKKLKQRGLKKKKNRTNVFAFVSPLQQLFGKSALTITMSRPSKGDRLTRGLLACSLWSGRKSTLAPFSRNKRPGPWKGGEVTGLSQGAKCQQGFIFHPS